MTALRLADGKVGSVFVTIPSASEYYSSKMLKILIFISQIWSLKNWSTFENTLHLALRVWLSSDWFIWSIALHVNLCASVWWMQLLLIFFSEIVVKCIYFIIFLLFIIRILHHSQQCHSVYKKLMILCIGLKSVSSSDISRFSST